MKPLDAAPGDVQVLMVEGEVETGVAVVTGIAAEVTGVTTGVADRMIGGANMVTGTVVEGGSPAPAIIMSTQIQGRKKY